MTGYLDDNMTKLNVKMAMLSCYQGPVITIIILYILLSKLNILYITVLMDFYEYYFLGKVKILKIPTFCMLQQPWFMLHSRILTPGQKEQIYPIRFSFLNKNTIC
jgi:hypothetical protein